MRSIRRWANAVEDGLRGTSGLAALLSQRVTIGETREQQLLEVLRRFLPVTLALGRGQIVDSHGNHSKQLDIVIARGDTIRLPLSESTSAYPFESVIGAVEVKSHLKRSTLTEAFRVAGSIFNLGFVVTLSDDPRSKKRQREGDWLTEEEVKRMFPLTLYPSCYVYAYESQLPKDTNRIGEIILDCMQEAGLNLDCLPSVIAARGWVAIRNDSVLIPPDVYPHKWLIAYRREDYPLYWILAHILFKVTMFLGGSSIEAPKARLHIEAHLDELPTDEWNLVLDPRGSV